MKKFFSLVLALVMAMSLTTVAWGASVVPTGDYTFTSTTVDLTNADIVDYVGSSTSSYPAWIHYEGSADITIDLGGLTFTMPTGTVHVPVYIGGSGTVTITNGKIIGSTDSRCIVAVGGNATVNFENVEIVSNRDNGSGVAIFQMKGFDTTVNLFDGAKISAVGSYATTESYGELNVYDGAVVSYDSTGSNGNGTGSAIGVSGGTGVANIYGGTISTNATGANKSAVSTNSSGGTINITGGTITGETAVFALTDSYYNNPAEINISGGTINGALKKTAYGTASTEVVVKGGTFNTDVSDYLATGLEQTTDGVVVSEGGAVLGTKYDMVTTDIAATKTVGVTVSAFDAKAPKDTNKDGLMDQLGNVKYVEFSSMPGVAFVQVNSANDDADYTVYQTGTKVLFGYFKAVDSPFYKGNGVAFNDFGEKCGQYDDEPVAGTKYYTFEGDLYKTVSVFSGTNLMVGNTLTAVEVMTDEFVKHVAAYTYDKDYKVVGVKCAECGTPAVIYETFAAVPKADRADAVALAGNRYFVWLAGPGAVVDTETKVESAETFDAGIAMYVGMSVMAAAGSVVVLKKKD